MPWRNNNWVKNNWVQPVVFGLSDGILNALILATPAILRGDGAITNDLALRVSAVALLTAIFTVFVSEYAHLRFDLMRAERELNITQSGKLATSNLGRATTNNSIIVAILAGAFSFIGSLLPLVIGTLTPGFPGLAIAAALICLAILGAILARNVSSNPLVWAITFAVSGLVIALVGNMLHIVV